MNKIDNAPLFRRGGHGVINIIRHMNCFKDAVLLRDLVGHGVIDIICYICYVDVAVLLRMGMG